MRTSFAAVSVHSASSESDQFWINISVIYFITSNAAHTKHVATCLKGLLPHCTRCCEKCCNADYFLVRPIRIVTMCSHRDPSQLVPSDGGSSTGPWQCALSLLGQNSAGIDEIVGLTILGVMTLEANLPGSVLTRNTLIYIYWSSF